MARRTIGSNQYKTRLDATKYGLFPDGDLLAQQVYVYSPLASVSDGKDRRSPASFLRECQDPQCMSHRLIQLLRESPTPKLVLAAVQHPHATGAVLQEAADQARSRQRRKGLPPKEYQQAISIVLQHPECPWSLLEKETQKALTPVYVAAAVRNPLWGSYVMGMIETNPYKPAYLRAAVLGWLPDPPQEHHWEAAVTSESTSVRMDAARGPDLPLNLAHCMASDTSSRVRAALGENPNLPLDIALKLVKDVYLRYPLAAENVVQRSDCQLEVLLEALHHPHPTIRKLALAHPNLPEEYRALKQIV